MAIDPVNVLMGVGRLYVAATGAVFPLVDAVPNAATWTDLGDTQDGVSVEISQDLKEVEVDQSNVAVNAVRTKEGMVVKSKCAAATLENLAVLMGKTVTDTPAGVGTVGTKEMTFYKGWEVIKYAVLYRGTSPYDPDYPAQYEVPYGYFSGNITLEHKKDGNVAYAFEFHVLCDPLANTDADKFGRFIVQDAPAT